jgi:hypothetical protein
MVTLIENKSNLSTFTETDMSLISRCFTFSPGQIRTIKKFNSLKQKISNSLIPDKYERRMKEIALKYSEIRHELFEQFHIADYTPEQHLVFQQLRSDCNDKHNKIMICHVREMMSQTNLNKIEESIRNKPSDEVLQYQHSHLTHQLKMDRIDFDNAIIEGIKLICQLGHYLEFFQTFQRKMSQSANMKV